jgi:hypothetical protein
MSSAESPTARRTRQGRLAERILGSAGGMVGACATLIGLVKIIEPRHGPSNVDEYAGITAVAFVISAFLAHVALRLPHRRAALQGRLEVVADIIFLAAMVALAGIGVMFAYDVI